MVYKDRTLELQERARVAFGVVLIHNNEGSRDKEPPTSKSILSWLHYARVIGGGVTEGERVELMSTFFDEIGDIRKSMAEAQHNINCIRKGHDDMAKVVSTDKETIVRRQVEDVITITNRLMTVIKSSIDDIRIRNEEFMEVAPKATVDIKVRDTTYKGLCTRFNTLITEYQLAQSDFTKYVKSRAFNNLRMTLPDATIEEIDELIHSGVRPSKVLQQKMMIREGGTSIDAHVCMINKLQNMQDKYSDLRSLEEAVVDLRQLFMEMAVLVHQQNEILDNIEFNVVNAKHHTAEAERSLISARKHQRSAQKTRLCIVIICITFLVILLIPTISATTTKTAMNNIS